MTPSNPSAAELRRRAEARLSEKQKSQRSQAGAQRTAPDTLRLIQELQIHQIELEMQNEQLEQARATTEAALERYTDLYDFAPAGYFTLDRNETIRQANLTGSELLGVNRSLLVNRRFGLFVAENSRPDFRAFAEKVFASQSQEACEALLLREGKSPFHARIEARTFADGQECRFVVTDITEQSQAEEALRERDTELREAQRITKVGNWKLEGETVTWSEEMFRIFGRDPMLPPPSYSEHPEILTPESWARLQVIIEKATKTGTPYEMNLEIVCPDGTRKWIIARGEAVRNEEGRITALRGTAQDITEHMRSEQALRLQAKLFDQTYDAIIVWDWDGPITFWNRGAERLYGFSGEEAVGRVGNQLLHTKFADGLEAVLQLLERRGSWEGELEHTGRDGQCITVESRMVLVREAEHTFGLAINRDITARKLVEEEIRRLNADLDRRVSERTAQLRAANVELHKEIAERKKVERALDEKNIELQNAAEAKDRFLANMSHELRTPLNGIIGFAEFLVDGKPGALNPKQKEYLEDILNSGKHLLQLISDLLDLVKVGAGKMKFNPERFSIRKAIEEACAVANAIAQKKGIHIEVNVTPESGEVTLDPQKFKQILYNLLSNAIKFNRDGGNVEILAAPHDAHHFKLVVEDTGVGIKREDLGRLFKEFEQLDSGTSRRHEGTGLGLAVTRKIVELQGGTIGVESEFGQGTRFTVVLPFSLPEAGPVRTSRKETELTPESAETKAASP